MGVHPCSPSTAAPSATRIDRAAFEAGIRSKAATSRGSATRARSRSWLREATASANVLLKYFKLDPIRGEWIVMMKAPIDMQLPRHHHTGTVIVHTLEGKWKYKEHDWVAGPGSVWRSRTGRPAWLAISPIAKPTASSRGISPASIETEGFVLNARGTDVQVAFLRPFRP